MRRVRQRGGYAGRDVTSRPASSRGTGRSQIGKSVPALPLPMPAADCHLSGDLMVCARWADDLGWVLGILLVSLMAASSAAAQQYNPYTKSFELAPRGAQPRYNPSTGGYERSTPSERLQFNPYTGKQEYAPEGARPQYNPYTKKHELTVPHWRR